MQQIENTKGAFLDSLLEKALTAGMTERQLVEFRGRQLGLTDDQLNAALQLFDAAQVTKKMDMGEPAGPAPAAVKGSQEAAAAIARWQTRQKDLLDVAEDQLEVLEDMRNGIERGAIIIEPVEVN